MGPDAGITLDRRYALKRLIAKSEHASIFEATHTHLGRTVALRVLTDPSPRDVDALFEEARRLEAVEHPGVVRVHDAAETDGGDIYLVTEAMDGRPLDGLLATRGRFHLEEAIAITLAVGDALAAAHAKGVVHAGLCPSSILHVDKAGRGAAKLIDLGVSPSPMGVLSGPLAAMGYAAPERLSGSVGGPLGDVHALGAILWEMLTEQLPERDGERDVRALRPDIPDEVAFVLERSIAEATHRFADMTQLTDALREVTTSQALPITLPPPARRAHPRAAYVTPVRLRVPGGDSLDGRCEDISEGGLLTLVSGEVETGVEVLARFALPSSGRMVSLPAETRWSREVGGKLAVGLQFIDPGEKIAEDIRAYAEYMGTPVEDEE